MNIIFNEKSMQGLDNVDEDILQRFVETCKTLKQVNDIIGESAFRLRISTNFWNLSIWSNEENKYADPNYLFLQSIFESPYLPETPEYEIDDSIFLDNTLLLENEILDADAGIRVAASWKKGALVLSFDTSDWNRKQQFIIKRKDADDIVVKNAIYPEQIVELLEFFPIWENYDFSKWEKQPFNKTNKAGEKGENYIRNAKYNVKVLPIPKLSDLVWLNFIGEDEIWDEDDRTRTRGVLWQKFVDKLDTFPNNGEKEAKIFPIFEKIVRVNQFHNAKSVCAKPERPIFAWENKRKAEFYLLPDKQHGAFEVYNDSLKHQGEWHFYGDENMYKPAEKERNICN